MAVKVYYIPVIIPLYKRSLVAVFLSVAAFILIFVGAFSAEWKLFHNAAEAVYGSGGHLDANVGLRYYRVRTCQVTEFWRGSTNGTSRGSDVVPCQTRTVLFTKCEAGTLWCKGHRLASAAFALFIVAGLLALLSVLTALVRERATGIVHFLGSAAAVAAFWCAYQADVEFTNNEGKNLAQSPNLIHRMEIGWGTYVTLTGGACLAVASTLTLSLLCCWQGDAKVFGGDEGVQERPRVVAVEMPGVTKTEIRGKIGAARPGFVHMGDGNNHHGGVGGTDTRFSLGHAELDEDDDIELIEELPSAAPATAAQGTGQRQVDYETTAPPMEDL